MIVFNTTDENLLKEDKLAMKLPVEVIKVFDTRLTTTPEEGFNNGFSICGACNQLYPSFN